MNCLSSCSRYLVLSTATTVLLSSFPTWPTQAAFKVQSIDREGDPVIASKLPSLLKNRKKYSRMIRKVAAEHNVSPSLLAAVVEHESQWDPHALSKRGALGLMQLMPGTAKEFGVQNPFDPEDNMRGGARYLRFLMDMFKEDMPLTLAAYHQGHSRVKALNAVPKTGGTRAYITRILKTYQSLDAGTQLSSTF